jgi:hypothetical protein
MVFQYVHAPRATEVERKLQEIRSSNDKSYIENTINSVIQTPAKKVLDQNIKPNKQFMEAYKKRVKVEEKEKEKSQFLENIDEEGYKIEKVYDSNYFKMLHDPLSVYNSKGNYKDLAWKVFSDCDEKHTFLKTLYYPELRTEDYNTLIKHFSNEHSKFPVIQNCIFAGSLGFAYGGFYLSNNSLRFTMRSSLVSSALFFGFTWYALNRYAVNACNSKLNFKALEVTRKYPEIKTTSVTYARINV